MSTTDTTVVQIPNYVAGTWTIDAVHSDVSFSVRHMMVSKVKGRFGSFEGQLVTGANPLESSITATVDLASIDTNNADRDTHIRSADFFDTEAHQTLTYRSTGVRRNGHDFVVDGELTLKGITKPVALDLEVNGFGPDAYGGTRAGFSASTTISRSDFGVDINLPMDGGGVVIGDKVQIHLEIEAVLATPEA